ncbi:MAG TPA: hypothetical protein VGK94_04480 [Candidatus Polarisedimenticolia bacterium]|jgi:hypothetical protein
MGAVRSNTHAWTLALLLCLPALIPASLPGWFEGHDDLHIYRLIEYDAALRDGQVPPRWFPDISAGYGNPHPNYYAPLFYIVAEVFHLAGAGLILSLKLAIAAFLLLTSVTMYRLALPFVGTAGALVAAAAYTYAPYHLLDLYVRMAFSELTVFAFLPSLLLAFHNLRTRGSRWDLVAGSLSMAAMSTAHTITLMLVPPLLGAYALFISMKIAGPAGEGRWRWLGRGAAAAALGYALAGFYVVPVLLERGQVNLKIYTDSYFDYQKHFVYPRQLVWWPWGFGMSLEGLKDKMSFRLGLLQIAGTAAAAVGTLGARRRSSPAKVHVIFFLGVTVAALFMMLPISAPFWSLLAPLRFVQFPWRFLTLTTLSTAFLCGAAFSRYAGRAPVIAALGACALFPAGAAIGGCLGVHLRVPESRIGFDKTPYNNMLDRGPEAALAPETLDRSFVREHALHWIDHLPSEVGFNDVAESDLARPKVEVVEGGARVSDVVARTWLVRCHVEAFSPSRLRVNLYRFPGWTVRVDGVVAPMIEIPKRQKVIFFEVSPGSHEVQVLLERTFPRRLGDGLTLAALATLAVARLWPQRRAAGS